MRACVLFPTMLACTPLLSGCLTGGRYVEQIPEGRPLFTSDETEIVVVGETTREDVLLQLGQPYWTTEDDSLLIYAWIQGETTQALFFVLPFWWTDCAITLYLVQLDEEQRVVRAGLRSTKDSEAFDEVEWWSVAHDAVVDWLATAPRADAVGGSNAARIQLRAQPSGIASESSRDL